MDSDKIVEKLLEYMQRTEDFTLQQAPEIFQEMIKWSIASVFIDFLYIVAVILIGYIFRKNIEHLLAVLQDFGTFIASVLLTIFVVTSFFVLGSGIEKAMKAYISPKYFIISELIGKTKSKD